MKLVGETIISSKVHLKVLKELGVYSGVECMLRMHKALGLSPTTHTHLTIHIDQFQVMDFHDQHFTLNFMLW